MTLKKILSICLFPLGVFTGYSISRYLLGITTFNPLVNATAFTFALGYISFCELILPFSREKADKKTFFMYLKYTLVNTSIVGSISSVVFITLATMLCHLLFDRPTLIPELTKLSFILQLGVYFFLDEFLRYWAHRMCHKFSFFWRFHKVHHSVDRIQVINTFYVHPLDYVIRNVIPASMVIIVLGFSESVIFIGTFINIVVGLFSHSAINSRHYFLNYIFATNTVHRWHHSNQFKKYNSNFGVVFIFWDLIFGTFYLPKNESAPETYLKQYLSSETD